MIEETENQEQSLEELIERVEQDDLPTNVFTNEDTDPMVLLGKINEVIGYLRTLQGTIESSDTKATQALASAIQALETANTALSSSSTALTNANQALSTANTAISSANTAVETANTASTTATEAKQTAEGIASTANQALSTAQSANATANSASATANSASATATEAKQTAEGIAGTANQALTTANNASATANNANSTAQQALTTAQGKQDALTETQLNAVNSGITSALVEQIRTNTTNIAGKQDQLTQSQLDAVNSGINSTKVAEIDNKVEQITQPSKIYGTDSYGDQTTYAISTGALGIVQRQASSGNITVPPTPNSNNDATSKSYVDDKTVPTEWQTPTINSTYISGGTVRYTQIGNLVIVKFWDIKFTQYAVDNMGSSNAHVIISGLPAGSVGMLCLVNDGSSKQIRIAGLGEYANGRISSWWSAPASANDVYYGEVVYIKDKYI